MNINMYITYTIHLNISEMLMYNSFKRLSFNANIKSYNNNNNNNLRSCIYNSTYNKLNF